MRTNLLKNKVAITCGDPAGIGPEVLLQALISYNGEFDFIPIVIGNIEYLEKYYGQLTKKLNIEKYSDGIEATPGIVYFYHIKNYLENVSPGVPDSNSAKASLEYIDCSIDLFKKNIIDAVATAPVNKGNIEKTGIDFIGHTEYYAKILNENNPYMMMFSSKYRVLLVTTHYPVEQVRSIITENKIIETVKTGVEAIKAMGQDNPSVAICGLDPHCGDNGAIGCFDDSVTVPAIKKLKIEGYNVEGPFAADTLFMKKKWSSFDLAVAMYHDQGLIPFKMLAFEEGVNITLGLSIVRTSADHGTAYDIAGKMIAEYGSMKSAIDSADMLAKIRKKLS